MLINADYAFRNRIHNSLDRHIPLLKLLTAFFPLMFYAQLIQGLIYSVIDLIIISFGHHISDSHRFDKRLKGQTSYRDLDSHIVKFSKLCLDICFTIFRFKRENHHTRHERTAFIENVFIANTRCQKCDSVGNLPSVLV